MLGIDAGVIVQDLHNAVITDNRVIQGHSFRLIGQTRQRLLNLARRRMMDADLSCAPPCSGLQPDSRMSGQETAIFDSDEYLV